MATPPLMEYCKKRKRTAKYYGFHTFADPACPIQPTGAFRDNIRIFLQECAELEDYNVEGMPIWCTFLVHENRGLVLPLYTIEESVEHSVRPFCEHCRCAGWSHHYVSKRKYHLIIPVDEEWNKPLDDSVFDLQNHLLHGLIHCNGFGHLLCINGIEGGSKYFCGREIMDLWDRICTNLHTWKITVGDLSKKHLMDLRLLHAVAYGHPWFGRWGYRFCHGSFGVTEYTYDRAIEILSSLQLDQIINDFSFTNSSRQIKQILHCYRDLSETNLITIRDLFRFMLTLKSRTSLVRKAAAATTIGSTSSEYSARTAPQTRYMRKEKSGKCQNFTTVAANMDSRWPVRRLEFTANVIVDALKERRLENNLEGCGMTRQEARDAARLYIGDTGLIDHVLKSMNNVIVGDYVVRRVVNRLTRKLEYSIQELKNVSEVDPGPVSKPVVEVPVLMPGTDVYHDVSYLYANVLFGYPDSDVVELAVRTILDSKYFVKEWPFRDEPDDSLRFICRLIPSSIDLKPELTRKFSPGEHIMLSLHATIGDLKEAIQIAMRDTYYVMEQLEVTEIEQMEELSDEELLFGIVQSGAELFARGYGLDLNTDLKHEGGADNWAVRCKCGAQDDDGERMVSCDICEIWQHTRCSGIEDKEEVPPLFVCETCCSSLAPQKPQRSFEFDCYRATSPPLMSQIHMQLLY